MKLAAKKKEKPAAGGEKKAKRKSSRGSGDGVAKLKSFLADHVEKLLLGAMALVALLLVYSGFSKESLTTDPDSVASEVSRAQSSMNRLTWSQVKQERQPEPDRFDQQATQDTIDIDPNAYAMNVPFYPRLQEQGKRRSDPELLAPFDIEVRAGYGALAVKSSGRDSAIDSVLERNSPDLRPVPPELSPGPGDTPLGGSYESRFFIAITGLIPYKKQFDLYQEAFASAAEFEPERDVPTYFGLGIERAEVQPDGTLADWQPLDTPKVMMVEPNRWDSRPDESADPNYLIPELTMPLPPLVRRDVNQWARHSTVPANELNQPGQSEEMRGRSEGGESIEETETEVDWTARAHGDQGPRRRDGADETAADMSGSQEVAEPALKVDNGMLRYFDFTVEPGKKYKYRVRAVLEDPNNPVDNAKPSDANCEPEVLTRVISATDKLRRTGWSEPSDEAVVPTGHRVLVQSVEAPNLAGVGPRQIRIERKATDEPLANLMTLTWKVDGPYDVPVVLKVGRGAVLNGTADKTEAVDPVAGRLRTLSRYRFTTDAIVLDVYGGVSPPGLPSSPGFMLVRTADGRLEFHSESGDFAAVKKNTIPPPEEEAKAEEAKPEERPEETRFEEGSPDRPNNRGGERNRPRRNQRER